MKRIPVFIFLIFSFSLAIGQESLISNEMEMLSTTLKIEDSQRAQLSKIIIRKHNDLASISDLQRTDEQAFRAKRRAVYKGAENSIKLMLNKKQLENWRTYKAKMRSENAKKITALKAEQASKEDLLDAQYGIDN